MTKKKILIVEDDPILLLTLNDNLVSEGFEIIKAKDGEEGLAFALDKKPDLILLDIILPKMDGLTMLKKLRGDEWGKNVKVIILTNLGSPSDILKALETIDSMNALKDYLVKTDWKIEDVVARVRERLNE